MSKYLLGSRGQTVSHIIEFLEDFFRVNWELTALNKFAKNFVPSLLYAVIFAAKHFRRQRKVEEQS